MSNYCLVIDGAIIEGPRALPDSWGYVSGLAALSENDLRDMGWLPVVDDDLPRRPWEQYGAPALIVESDRVVRMREPVVLALADAIAHQRRACDLIARSKRDAIVADYSPAEMAAWPIKRAEALAWQTSSDDADAPNLVAEASARQITLADLVVKVLTKAAALSALEAQIAGYCGRLQDQITASASLDDLALIDITVGWPV